MSGYERLRNSDASPRGNQELPQKQTGKASDIDFWFDAEHLPEIPKEHSPPEPVERLPCKDVGVYVNVMEIQEIDQVKETFTAIFVLAFQYVDPTLKDHYLEVKYIDGKESVKKVEAQIRGIEEGRGRICMRPKGNTGTPLRIFQRDLLAFTNHPDWDKHMKLDWSFMNAVEEPEKMTESRRIEYFTDEGAHVKHKIKFRGKFSDDLHLRRMPYDRQILRIQVVGEVPVYMMRFLPIKVEAGHLSWHKSRKERRVPAEWAVDPRKLPQLEVLVEEGPTSRARFDVHTFVERLPNYYINNLVLFVGMFTLSTGFAFTSAVTTEQKDSDPMSEHKQMDILLTLLLTTVAHKIVLASWLPVRPYETLLDVYILCCFVFQVGVMFYCVWAERIEEKLAEWANDAEAAGWHWAHSLYQFYAHCGSYIVYVPLSLFHLLLIMVTWFHENCVGHWLYYHLFIPDWRSVYMRKQVWPEDRSIYRQDHGHRPAEPETESESDSET